MKTKMTFIVAVGFAIFSCSSRQDSSSSDEISGAYAREYSFKVANPESGSEIGMRTIRDTIFIRPAENGYEVSNRKWRLNDYDNEGWQSMEHSEDRPVKTYQGIFDRANNALINETELPIYLNSKEDRIYRGEKSKTFFNRIKEPRNIF